MPRTLTIVQVCESICTLEFFWVLRDGQTDMLLYYAHVHLQQIHQYVHMRLENKCMRIINACLYGFFMKYTHIKVCMYVS
jgi:hypothetical protein